MYNGLLENWIGAEQWEAADELLRMQCVDHLGGNKNVIPDSTKVEDVVNGLCAASLVQRASILVQRLLRLPCYDIKAIIGHCTRVAAAYRAMGLVEDAEKLLTSIEGQLSRNGRLENSLQRKLSDPSAPNFDGSCDRHASLFSSRPPLLNKAQPDVPPLAGDMDSCCMMDPTLVGVVGCLHSASSNVDLGGSQFEANANGYIPHSFFDYF